MKLKDKTQKIESLRKRIAFAKNLIEIFSETVQTAELTKATNMIATEIRGCEAKLALCRAGSWD